MIDPYSELITNVIGNVVLFAAMLLYWRTQKTYRGFGMWTFATLIAGAFYLPLFLPPGTPTVLSGGLSCVLALVLVPLYFEGARAFYGARRLDRVTIAVVGAAVLVILFFSTIENSPAVRNLVVIGVHGTYAVIAASLLLRNMQDGRRFLPAALGTLALLYAASLLWRGVVWIVNPSSTLFSAGLGNGVFFLTNHLVHMVVVIFLLMLNGERIAGDLKRSQRELEIRATVDPMTGAYTRREFLDIVELAVKGSRRYSHALCVMMFDIDRFKETNDNFGHPAGDAVLEQVVQMTRNHIRAVDSIGRLGGDEFAVCLPESTVGEAGRAAERIRAAICDEPLLFNGMKIPVTISIGLAELRISEDDVSSVLERADRCLYESKRRGRNRVTSVDPGTAPAESSDDSSADQAAPSGAGEHATDK